MNIESTIELFLRFDVSFLKIEDLTLIIQCDQGVLFGYLSVNSKSLIVGIGVCLGFLWVAMIKIYIINFTIELLSYERKVLHFWKDNN